jgi:hypothetical protein
MKKTLLVIGVVLGLGLTAQAQKKKESLHDQFTGQGYGMAGCGLGSVVFGQKKGMVQVFASTTNGIYQNQTFGISSGTSNCGDSKGQATSEFIKANKIALEKDVVRGQGETLASLVEVMSCKNSDFSTSMKKNYSVEFPQGGATDGQLEAVAYKSCQI